jgi:hypothetical protein
MAKLGEVQEDIFEQEQIPEDPVDGEVPIVPIPGGATLEEGELISPNYVKGSSGWKIAADGSAEFTNVIVNGSSLALSPFYGDGSDGTTTISGSTSLTKDTYYDNLTIVAGGILNTAGYRLFVKGTLTANGTITRKGNSGGDGDDASGITGGVAGGTAGGALTAGTLSGTPAGKAGVAGPDGLGGAGSGTNGNAGTAGDASTHLVVDTAVAGGAGGQGGDGGGGNNGGAAGTAGAAGATTDSNIKPRYYLDAMNMLDDDGSKLVSTGNNGGSGSGGSGGHRVDGAADGVSGGGGASAGSGSNGGIMLICARIFSGSGLLTVQGGHGGGGGDGGNATSPGNDGNGGGGGGAGGDAGNGGVIVMLYNQKTFTGTLSVSKGAAGSGGTAGTGAGGGNPGVDGDDGVAASDGSLIELVM